MEWIEQFPKENREDIICQMATLGYQISKMVHLRFDTDNEIVKTILSQFKEIHNTKNLEVLKELYRLNEKVAVLSVGYEQIQTTCSRMCDATDGLISYSNNSCKKGKIGETRFEKFVSCRFGNKYTIENKTKEEHQGDYHIYGNTLPKTLIDTKFYKSYVPKKEIEKLKDDMIQNGIKYGILISYTSAISKRKRLELESYGDKHIIYIPYANEYECDIISAFMLIEYLHKNDKIDNINIKIDKLIGSTHFFDKLLENNDKVLSKTLKAREEIFKSYNTLEQNIISCKIENEEIINQFKQILFK